MNILRYVYLYLYMFPLSSCLKENIYCIIYEYTYDYGDIRDFFMYIYNVKRYLLPDNYLLYENLFDAPNSGYNMSLIPECCTYIGK